MGLDLVELVLAVESTFGIEIPDEDAARLETPRNVIDYLTLRLPVTDATDATCRSQQAFYRTRGAIAQRFGVRRQGLRRESSLRQVLGTRTGEWKALGQDVGARAWPRLKSDNWLFAAAGGVSTLGELAQHMAMYDAALLHGADARWTRSEIETLFLSVLEMETGVDMSKFTLDSYFVRDMGLD